MSPTLERILHDAQTLTAQEREQLLRELEAGRPRSAVARPAAAAAIFGKYAFVPAPGEEFCARKAHEIELEDRRSF